VIEANWLLDILPTSIIAAAVSVKKDDAIGCHPALDVGHGTAIDRPLPPETLPRYQDTGPLQPTDVERPRIFGGARRAVVPVSPAADSAHCFLLPDFTEIIKKSCRPLPARTWLKPFHTWLCAAFHDASVSAGTELL
jgi:hypothetical protein